MLSYARIEPKGLHVLLYDMEEIEESTQDILKKQNDAECGWIGAKPSSKLLLCSKKT